MNYTRGDIVWIDFGQAFGSEQGGIRPALIVQNNIGNQHSPCIIVIPITTSRTKHIIPTQKVINLDNVHGIALGEQIRTMDKKRITDVNVIDHITDMKMVDKALAISIGLKLAI